METLKTFKILKELPMFVGYFVLCFVYIATTVAYAATYEVVAVEDDSDSFIPTHEEIVEFIEADVARIQAEEYLAERTAAKEAAEEANRIAAEEAAAAAAAEAAAAEEAAKKATQTTSSSSSSSSSSYSHWFKNTGVYWYNGVKYTWYSQRTLPGGGLTALNNNGRTVNSDGFVTDGDGYLAVASSDYSIGTILETPFGTAKVYDSGCASGVVDMYTDW